jgi:glycosyltransferase involved in cell wall biosynthesis
MPSRNRLERLPALIRNYLDQGADEIIVVLDGPHPGWHESLSEQAAEARVQIDELPSNRGLALARTAGLERASMDVVIIADDDVVPLPGMVDRHRSFHASHVDHALLGYMPVDLPEHRGRDQAATYVYAKDYANQVEIWRSAEPSTLLDSFWGGNASLPASLYRRAEAYKPSQRLNYNEDLDLGIRLGLIGAGAGFDERAKGLHQHSRDFASFLRECVVRGEAVADLEARWQKLPYQLTELVQIPDGQRAIAASVQRRIGARDTAGLLEGVAIAAYRVAGIAKLWPVQDAIARLLRRGLAIRGYRIARAKQVTKR